MEIEQKKIWVRQKKQEIPPHVLEMGLNMLFEEPRDIFSKLKNSQPLKPLQLEQIIDAQEDLVFVDAIKMPYTAEFDNVGFAKQLNPKLNVAVKDILVEEYQVYLHRIYGFDGIIFPISHLTKKLTETFIFMCDSMGMLPIPIIENELDLEKINSIELKAAITQFNKNGLVKLKQSREGYISKC
ncbi:beta/alpha barrel domain-containing protein [Hippea jasoniae]|uniref:hypothetical protein n=1 Tax=Hippea jasoniae TaxID=944479 RepID=UPI0005533FFA|nr:hypothetical protein [Hippea jasoniae]